MGLAASVRFTVICDECVRIEYAPDGRFVDAPSLFAIHGPGGSLPLDHPARSCTIVSTQPGQPSIVIRTKRFELVHTPDGNPPSASNTLAHITHDCPPEDVPKRDGRVLWSPGSIAKHNLGGTIATLDGLRTSVDLGQGLLSRDGWHVVDDSQRHLLIDGWATPRSSLGMDQNFDWYLFAYGSDYAGAFNALAIIAGKVPLPRRYALGSWYSRYWPYTSNEYRGIVDEYTTHGFPLDVLVMDMDWHRAGWTGWSWNRDLLPDAEDLVHWLHAQGLAVTLNLHPADGVGPHEDQYAPFMRALDLEPDGSTLAFDAGNQKYMAAIFKHVHTPLERPAAGLSSGIDFWWVDWQQSPVVASIPGLSSWRWLNHLYYQHTTRQPQARADGSHDPGIRGLNLARWAADEAARSNAPSHADSSGEYSWGLAPPTGGWGDHRYPIHFSGDAHTGWSMLEFQVAMTSTAGNVGCFYWSHDIGGHFGPRIEEAMTRWVQFGALSPVLRLHSARTGALDRRPWTYEQHFCNSMRLAFALRSALMPSIYTAVRQAHDLTLPLIRPMYLAYPAEQCAYECPGQYMLGEDLLAIPVTSLGVGDRCIAPVFCWIPITSRENSPAPGWFDLRTGEEHLSGSHTFIPADIDHTPLLARAGAPIFMRPPSLRMADGVLDELVIQTFAPSHTANIERTLYEDDGISLGHTLGQSARTRITAHWSTTAATTPHHAGASLRMTLELVIHPTDGQFAGQSPSRAYTFRVGGVHAVQSVSIDDAPATGSFQPLDWLRSPAESPTSTRDFESLAPAAQALVVTVPARGINKPLRIRINFERSDNRLHARQLRAHALGACVNEHVSIAHLPDRLIHAAGTQHATSETLDPRFLAIGAGIGCQTIQNADKLEVIVIDSVGWLTDRPLRADILESLGPPNRPESQNILSSHALTLTGSPGTHARSARLFVPADPLPEPPLGLKAQRSTRIHATFHNHPIAFEHTLASRLRPLTTGLVLGPFDWDWRWAIDEHALDPERTFLDWSRQPENPFDSLKPWPARSGHFARWQPVHQGARWPVDLRRSLFGERSGVGLFAACILSPIDQPCALRLDCGDKAMLWLNAQNLLTVDGFSAHQPPEPVAHAHLRAGLNPLLIKLSDGGGGWGFSLTLEASTPLEAKAP